MPVTRAQKVRLGVFVIGGLVVMLGGLVILAGASLGEVRDEYTVRYSEGTVSLSGLDVGSPVKYSGIRVGRVDRIGIAPDDLSVIEVALSMQEGTPIAMDSKANLGSMGITGLKYIELSRGTKAAGLRTPGSDIPPGTAGLDELANQAGEIAEKVSVTIDRVNALVAPEMKDRVASVLDRTDKLLETVEATVSENRVTLKRLGERTEAAVAEAERLLVELNGVASSTRGVIDRAAPGIERTLRATRKLLVDLGGTRENLDDALGSVDMVMQSANDALLAVMPLLDRGNLLVQQSQENVVEALSYLRETAENLTDFSRRVREDPSLLLLGGEEGP